MKVIKTIALAVSSLMVTPFCVYGKEISPAQTGMVMMRLNAAPLANHQSIFSKYGQGDSLWASLRSNFHMQEVNSSLVRNHEAKYLANPAYFNRTITRSRPYMYHIYHEVQKRGMPAEIALLPFIESAYVTKARSHVGASGLWQFMPSTGRHYGLEQTPLYDGRHDIYAATDAALNYLQYLYGLFGDWPLALAAYNWGEGNVSKAVRRAQAAGLEANYENIKMPTETRNYVPKLLAVRNIVANSQMYGLNLPEINNAPYFKAITVHNPLDISAAARLANISESEFLELNPAFNTPVFMPKDSRKMLLPITAANIFEKNYRNSDSKTLLSWDIYTPYYAMTLDEISQQTGTSIADIKRLNGIASNTVAAGRSILVHKNGTQLSNTTNFARIDSDNTPDNFVVQQPVIIKTSSQTINSTFPSQSQGTGIAAPNHINEVRLQPTAIPPSATQLAIVSSIPSATSTVNNKIEENRNITINTSSVTSTLSSVNQQISTQQVVDPIAAFTQSETQPVAAATSNNITPNSHLVSEGDTLYNIAKRYDINIEKLIQINNINNNTIRIGQTLRLPQN